MIGYADLHLHTTASDGSMTPPELVAYAKANGLSVISVTDHDTVSGLALAMASADGIRVIPGVEFSSLYDGEGEPFRLHILGYGIDPEAPEIISAVEAGQAVRRRKHSLRLEYLKERFGIDLTEEDARQGSAMVGKISLAHLLIDGGYADTVQDAIGKFMSAPDFPEGRIPHSLAISAITASGGIPVYAHPLGGEGEEHLSKNEAERRIRLLADAGIRGAECYYSRYSRAEVSALVDISERLGLLVSGGSDFHGTNKTVKIGTLNTDGEKADADSLSVLGVLFEG